MMAYITAKDVATGDVTQVQLNRDFSTKAQRAGLRGIQFYSFCVGWSRNLRNPEPVAHDLKQQVRWVSDTLFTADSIDMDQKFTDPTSSTHQKISLQGPARAALATERRALYAYQQRLIALIQARDGGFAPEGALRAREDASFLALMASGYNQADHLLWNYYQSHCPAS